MIRQSRGISILIAAVVSGFFGLFSQPSHPHAKIGDLTSRLPALSQPAAALNQIVFSFPSFAVERYAWHTFYGSAAEQTVSAVGVDGSGNIYLAGTSQGSWLGDGGAAPLHAHSGDKDIFVMKLTNHGAYLWHTFYGSQYFDTANDLVVEADGDLLVTGVSTASWDVGDTEPLNGHSGLNDIVVLRLSASGGYSWHTFYGGAGSDLGNAVALSENGEALVVTGNSTVSWQGDSGQEAKHPFPTGGSAQLWVLKLDLNGGYLWHTFYGGGWMSDGTAIVTDTADDILVAGWSSDTWSGDGGLPPLHSHSGFPDILFLKLTLDGVYQWHSFYGSDSLDSAWGLAVDSLDHIFAVGTSSASWLGDLDTSPLHAFTGFSSISVLKLDSAGAYQWHTFYGSQDGENGEDLVLDGEGNIYVAGKSGSSWNGDQGAPPVHSYQGGGDALVLKLDPDGDYQWHTFYGSNAVDRLSGIALDPDDHLFAAGESSASWLGDSSAVPLHPHSPVSSSPDLMVLKLVKLPFVVFLPSVGG